MKLPSFGQRQSEFLTAKVHPKLTIIDYVLGFFLVLFEGLLIPTTVSLLLEGNLEAAGVGFALFAPLLWPLYARARNVLLSRKAVKVAEVLQGLRVKHLSGNELKKVLPYPNGAALMKKLINGSYLANITFDELKDRFFFVHRLELDVQEIPFTCPSCGAKGVLENWQKSACPYCGAGLTLPKNHAKESKMEA